MDEFKFNSINELYNRLLPAMETKKTPKYSYQKKKYGDT